MFIADKDRNGVIQYKEFVPLGAEVIHAIFVKNQAKRQLADREDGKAFLKNITTKLRVLLGSYYDSICR
jgi:hypothetical protein